MNKKIVTLNRLKSNNPKIGIRPILDGRGEGVRQYFEESAMKMAKSVRDLIYSNLRYSDGAPVECVIANRCIGGSAEAAQTSEKFANAGVCASITVTPTWCYPSEVMDMDLTNPKAIWGFNGTDWPGAVTLSAAVSAYAQKGISIFSIYSENIQDAGDMEIPKDVKQKILKFTKSALVVAAIRNKTYLSIGGISMGIAGSIYDPNFLENYLDIRYETVDMSEFTRRIEEKIYDPEEFKKAMCWVKKYCLEGVDPNPKNEQFSRVEKDRQWEISVKMAIIARDLMVGNPKLAELGFEEESFGYNAIASGFQGQRHWTDHYPSGDFMEGILNSSFDWNGTREPFIIATENDYLNGIAMLFGYLLTNTSQMFSDVRAFWSPTALKRVFGQSINGIAEDGIIHLNNSGPSTLDATGRQSLNGKPAMKPFWEITPEEISSCLNATKFCPQDKSDFRDGGFSTNFLTLGGMPVTMSRLNIIGGFGPVLQIAEGTTVDLPKEIAKKIMNRTSPTWPTTWFVPKLTDKGPFKSVYSVMNNWGANHSAISFGHIGSDLITLASMLRIPVSMHNVDEDNIFRPSVWSAFGDIDSKGADYRACSIYGPLYGRRRKY